MIIKRRKRKVPGLNATSTADISFILLVFFLVISSMDSNKGLQRQLPPPDQTKQVEITEMDHRNVLDIGIAADGRLTVDDKPIDRMALRRRLIGFLQGVTDRKSHVMVLRMKEQTQYDDYFFVQDEIQAAYNEMRDAWCRSRFGKSYAKCDERQKSRAVAEFPQRVSEMLTDASGNQISDKSAVKSQKSEFQAEDEAEIQKKGGGR